MQNVSLVKRDAAPVATAFGQAHSLADLQTLGDVFVRSGFFSDARDAAQAIVKVMAGQELGFPPIASMTGVYIVKGKVSLSANLIAAAIKRSGRYNYRVRQLDDEGCSIDFFEGAENIGNSKFTREDAVKAGLMSENYKKFPRNMFFARTLSNGAKWFCPDVFGGPIYTPDELGPVVDGETGEVIDVPTQPVQTKAAPVEQPKPQGRRDTLKVIVNELKAEGVTVEEIKAEAAKLCDGNSEFAKLSDGDVEGLIEEFVKWLEAIRASKGDGEQEAA